MQNTCLEPRRSENLNQYSTLIQTAPLTHANRGAACLLLAAAIFAAYQPAVSMPHLFMDDYPFLYSENPRQDVLAFFTSIGRPITAVYLMVCRYALGWKYGNEICHLIGMLGAIFMGCLSYVWLRRKSLSSLDAAILAFLLATLPGVQLYVAWITAGSSTYAACCAVLALLAFESSDAKSSVFRKWTSYVGAAVLLIVAQLIYQPAAMYFWTLSLVGIVIPEGQASRSIARRGCAYLTLGAVSIACYLATGKAICAAFDIAVEGRATPVPVEKIPAKLAWLFGEVLTNALLLWHHLPSPWVMWSVAAIIGLGIGIVLLKRVQRNRTGEQQNNSAISWHVAALVVVVAIVPMGNIFNAVIAQNWASFRSTFAFAASVLILFYVAIDAIASLTGNFQVVVRRLALVGCAVFALGSAHFNILERMLLPQVIELRYLEAQLGKAEEARHTRIHMIRPAWHQGICATVRYDEFGLPSSTASWVPVPMVRKALRDIGAQPDQFNFTHGTDAEPLPAEPDVFTIDMRELANLRTGPRLR